MRKAVTDKIQWHIIVIVCLILALSVVSWPQFVKEMRSGAKETAASADQKESGRLSALCASVDAAIDKADAKWSVCGQRTFSNLDKTVTYYGTGEISSAQVLAGADRWLFFKSKTNGNPIGDYEGTNLHTEQELEAIAQAALTAQNEIESRGIRFVILVPPNKEVVYWEKMPDTYVRAERTRTDILTEYLQQKGVNIVSPKKEMLDEHLSTQLYYAYDTHWNQLGAYMGARAALASLDIAIPALSERTVSSKALRGEYHYCAEDDLAKMVDMREIFSDEKEYEVVGTVPMDWKSFEAEQTAGSVSHFFNEEAPNKESVFLVGDSFRSSMVPALREQFADVYVVHYDLYSPEMLDEIRPEYLIAEYVERYSYNIGKLDTVLLGSD